MFDLHYDPRPEAAASLWATGYARTFAKVLEAFPKTTFIGHADAFWANVSADYRNEAPYPSGPIVRGGVTDK